MSSPGLPEPNVLARMLGLMDWRAGVHGRRSGLWNGKKSYLLCVHCHNPHSPRFKPLAPEPPPRRPELLR